MVAALWLNEKSQNGSVAKDCLSTLSGWEAADYYSWKKMDVDDDDDDDDDILLGSSRLLFVEKNRCWWWWWYNYIFSSLFCIIIRLVLYWRGSRLTTRPLLRATDIADRGTNNSRIMMENRPFMQLVSIYTLGSTQSIHWTLLNLCTALDNPYTGLDSIYALDSIYTLDLTQFIHWTLLNLYTGLNSIYTLDLTQSIHY